MKICHQYPTTRRFMLLRANIRRAYFSRVHEETKTLNLMQEHIKELDLRMSDKRYDKNSMFDLQ